MSDPKINTTALRELAKKGWGFHSLIPKSTMLLIAKEMDALRAQVAATTPSHKPKAACINESEPKACYRVRCQLGNECVNDNLSPRVKANDPCINCGIEVDPACWCERGRNAAK
jgi:hypothetical protein